jgi:glycosyltransferase involved in cell wall biosynthesis
MAVGASVPGASNNEARAGTGYYPPVMPFNLPRLLIDARMLDHSGIGIYLTNVLPGVLRRCASLRPLLLVLPSLMPRAREIAGTVAEVKAWGTAPLSVAELVSLRVGSPRDLWWSPHFNVPLMSRSALVVTLHDLLPISEAGALVERHKRLAVRLWLEAVRRRARRVICVSQFTRDEAIRLGGIRSEKTSVAYLGVDAAWTSAVASPDVAAAPYLLFVGLVKPHKNLMGLLRAFEILMPAMPHRLVVVGRHSTLRDVDRAALALAHRLGPRVELLENLPQARLINIVANADLLVQPSFYEGFGLPPLEAMAAGTPVLAARAGSLPEICDDAALYCDPRSPLDIAESIRRIVGDPSLRRRMSEHGRERARAFTWEACAAATSEALLAAWSEQ